MNATKETSKAQRNWLQFEMCDRKSIYGHTHGKPNMDMKHKEESQIDFIYNHI